MIDNEKVQSLIAPPPTQHPSIANHGADPIYDIVTLVHHSDMKVFLEYSFKSWKTHLHSSQKIYIIADPLALPILQEKLVNEELWKANAVVISQENYPFSFQDINIDPNGSKPTWFYQQLLVSLKKVDRLF